MDFDFNDEQELFRRSVRDFMQREAPRQKIREWEEEGHHPAEIVQKMASMGWFGLLFPEEYGGSDMDMVYHAVLAEEVSHQAYELVGCIGARIFMGHCLMQNGNKQQKDYYIPRVVNGEQAFSISVTEPDAGSDVASIRTSAVADGDSFVINGQKMFASNFMVPNNVAFLLTRTDPDAPKHRGLTVFLLDTRSPGVEARPIRTIGSRIHQQYAVYLDNVRLPRENIVGELNGGWKVLGSGLQLERMTVSITSVGLGQAAVDEAIRYAKERVQFGQPIGKFQAIAHMLADMQTEVDAARLLAYRSAFLVAKGRPALKEVCMSKLYAAEMVARVTNQGMQITGGYGYTVESDMSAYFRIARILTIGGGSSQIQRDIIARQLGL